MQEAQWFIDRGNDLLRVSKSDKEMGENLYGYPRQSGAVNRASLDLSRALADLRNPNVLRSPKA